jgi:hypothetical protein
MACHTLILEASEMNFPTSPLSPKSVVTLISYAIYFSMSDFLGIPSNRVIQDTFSKQTKIPQFLQIQIM